MPSNVWMLFVAALIPLVVGAVYYHKSVFGSAWMNTTGLTEDRINSGNKAVIFGVTYLFSVLIAFTLMQITIHQTGLFQLLANEPGVGVAGSEVQILLDDMMSKYGTNFRTFKHGALHGGILTVFLVLPIIGINALFERRGWKYIGIHFGYWFITLVLMGGLICQTLTF